MNVFTKDAVTYYKPMTIDEALKEYWVKPMTKFWEDYEKKWKGNSPSQIVSRLDKCHNKI